ncbi:MAG: hypothetical protein JKY01_05860, partial [Pseudomonadales bacterium]|nr:hypothetical protein [Pseudomonadales bacterium]
MKNVISSVLQALLLVYLFSAQTFADEIHKSGLIGLSGKDALQEYAFSLPQETTVDFALNILGKSTGELDAKMLLAQGVTQHFIVKLNETNTVTLAAGEYQVMVFSTLLDARFAHIEVKVSGSAVDIHDVLTIVDGAVVDANAYRNIRQDFTLNEQHVVTLALTDYASLIGLSPSAVFPLTHTFFSLLNSDDSSVFYSGGLDGFQGELEAGIINYNFILLLMLMLML